MSSPNAQCFRLTRRSVLALSGGALTASLLGDGPRASASAITAPLPIPALIEPRDGEPLRLSLQQTRHRFRPERATVASHGISAGHLAPVVRLRTGTEVAMRVENRLTEETTLHWHGLLIPSSVDGGPHNTIDPGGIWEPALRIAQPPATLWFHPHPHGATARQVYAGMAGMMIVSDGGDRDRGLPAAYGIDDLPVILQDKRFGPDGAPVYAPTTMDIMHGFLGDTLMVNGIIAPAHAAVPASLVRLRLLNGANARNFVLRLADGRPFFAIAGDAGLLPEPVELRELTVAPGERYEVLVDLGDGRPADLVTLPDPHHADTGPGGSAHGAGHGAAELLLRLVPDADLARDITRLPRGLPALAPPEIKSAVAWRGFVLDSMPMQPVSMAAPQTSQSSGHAHGGMPAFMSINGRPFAMDRVDETVRLASAEIWEVKAEDMPHPFHIHGVRFRVLANAERPPPPEQAGWKDTVLVDRQAEILVRFDHPAPPKIPFMYHCHILEHEDHGMMGQVAVV